MTAGVYRARDERLGREVALKFLAEPPTRDPRAVDRFTREASAVSALNHPNIVAVYDVGESVTVRFVAMELVSGRMRRDVVTRQRSMAEAARITDRFDTLDLRDAKILLDELC